jgi:hypothetical protein
MDSKTKAQLRQASVILSGGTVSASADIKYIQKNINRLDDYDLRAIEHKLKARDLSERLDVYVDERGKVSNTKLDLDLNKSVTALEKEIKKALGKDFGDIDFNAYNKVGEVIRTYYLSHKKGDSYTMSSQWYPNASLVNFLLWIVSDKIESNLAKAHEVMEEIGMKSDSKGTFELPGVTVKIFKNGRVDVKFKSPADADKMRETVLAWDKKAHPRNYR